MAFNVVVTSCRDAMILVKAQVTNHDLWIIQRDMATAFNPEEPALTQPLHWTALLVDEAAQVTEIDVLLALSVVSSPSEYPNSLLQPRLVMAGDEHQLGPRTSSNELTRPRILHFPLRTALRQAPVQRPSPLTFKDQTIIRPASVEAHHAAYYLLALHPTGSQLPFASGPY